MFRSLTRSPGNMETNKFLIPDFASKVRGLQVETGKDSYDVLEDWLQFAVQAANHPDGIDKRSVVTFVEILAEIQRAKDAEEWEIILNKFQLEFLKETFETVSKKRRWPAESARVVYVLLETFGL